MKQNLHKQWWYFSYLRITLFSILLVSSFNNGVAQFLSWPLRQANGFNDSGYYSITNYVDLDPTIGVKDYSCGSRTYNGHNGIDISINPFPWYKMQQNQVEVIAARSGKIVDKDDGNNDKSCNINSGLPANFITLEHEGGFRTFYLHLKTNSLTTKKIGENVQIGEYLGLVGSSGNSDGPHLHFEVRDKDNKVIEPFSGSCNNIQSLWAEQKPYDDSYINLLATLSNAPDFPTCPGIETPNFKNLFHPGDKVYFFAAYRDILKGQISKYNIYKPDKTIFTSWPWETDEEYLSYGYRYSYYILPNNAPYGKWLFEIIYGGKAYSHYFTVIEACPPSLIVSDNISGQANYQAGNDITSNATITGGLNTNITYRAGKDIFLTTGFKVTGESKFNALIGPCIYADENNIISNPPIEFSTEKTNINPSNDNKDIATQQDNLFKIYPNPFTTEFIMEFNLPQTAVASMVLTDLSGRNTVLINKELFFKGKQQRKIETLKLPKGLYAYRFIAGDYIQTGKLIKQ